MATKSIVDQCFKDGQGRVVLVQAPNSSLIVFVILLVLRVIFFDVPTLARVLQILAFGMIFVWAWLELTQGINYFRRALGLVVLVGIVCIMMGS
jgi:hypothetical protein